MRHNGTVGIDESAPLRGREAELGSLTRLLDAAREGRSEALVVRGEAGIGKTALLERVAGTADGFRVERTAGVESELGLAFAGLHQLCAPLLERLGAIPGPQRAALEVALGRRSGDPPDRFLVGLGTLSLLAEAAEERPLLCLVDDVQWLDEVSGQTLAFVARRVHAERLALVFGSRDPAHGAAAPDAFAGLPEIRLGALGEAEARDVFAAAVPARVDRRVRDRIIAEAHGNPLALLELARRTDLAELAGGFELPGGSSVPDRIEESFRHRAGELPEATRLLLVTAAAESLGDAGLLWRAADRLGVAAEAAEPAEAAGLVDIAAGVRFVHPLARSAVYRSAAPADRRRAHGALAAVTDPATEPDRRAWHRAQSVLGTDEAAAAGLEHSAGRARARGGLAASAAFLERAVSLTPEPADRARRALAAAQARQESGAQDAALELLAVAATGPLDAPERARAELLRAQIEFIRTRGGTAPGMVMNAAKALAPLDPPLSRKTYLRAIEAAVHVGVLATERGVMEAAEAAREAPAAPEPPRPIDLLMDGLVARFTRGYEASVPGLRGALGAFLDRMDAMEDDRTGLWLAGGAALGLLDDAALMAVTGGHVEVARDLGAMAGLATALTVHAVAVAHTGDLARAAGLVAEETAITQAIGTPSMPHARLTLAALHGDRAETERLRRTMVEDAVGRGEGAAVTLSQYALAVLHNGLGDYGAALEAALGPYGHDELAYGAIAMPEVVEAAVRTGDTGRAEEASRRLSARARAAGSPWALGLAARSRALVEAGSAAEAQHREAIERLGGCRMATDLARAELLYGEWLRREGRRRDARERLRAAHDRFTSMGVDGFAARAARELRATGEQPRKRTEQPTDALTAHELQVARLVATGATSKEVASRLFLSPRTVDAHLRNIFRKLSLTSRRQLKEYRLP